MFIQPFSFVNYYLLELNLMISVFFISRRHITADWGRDTGTILRPTWISIRICGWRQDHLVDPIEIRCTNSPTPRPTCRWPVVSQPLGACNRYRPPSLKSSRPCNNIQPISLKNMNNSMRIMMNSVEWPWIWDHRWVVRVRLLFGHMVPGTINLLQRHHFSSLILFEHINL
jgi:hypothetical protein